MATLKRVGLPLRLLAYIIDNFFIALITILLINLTSSHSLAVLTKTREIMQLYFSQPQTLSPIQEELLNSIRMFNSYLWSVGIAYMLVEAYRGASFGKQILSLQITDLQGRLAPGKRYITRFILKNISALSFILSSSLKLNFLLPLGQSMGTIIGIGFLLTLNVHAMGIHDYISGTIVVNKRDINHQGE
jgi:uncharacterized RDD family membrane protein YckC